MSAYQLCLGGDILFFVLKKRIVILKLLFVLKVMNCRLKDKCDYVLVLIIIIIF